MKPDRGRAFTLVEVMVAMTVGVIALGAAYTVIGGMTRGSASTDKKASRAIVTARVMEYLMTDLRSAKQVEPIGPGQYRIQRYVPGTGGGGGGLTTQDITWIGANDQVTRQVSGGPIQTFSFQGMLDPETPGVAFRLERLPDVLFQTQP